MQQAKLPPQTQSRVSNF